MKIDIIFTNPPFNDELQKDFFKLYHSLNPDCIFVISKVSFLTNPKTKYIRDNILPHYKFIYGFVCHAKFYDCKGNFPIAHTMLKKGKNDTVYSYDILNENYKKQFFASDSPLRDLIDNPKGTEIAPPLSSALVLFTGKIRCDKLAPNSLGYWTSGGNNIMEAKSTCILSSAAGRNQGGSITENNFEWVMIFCTVRKIAPHTWLNDRDEFFKPSFSLTDVW